MNIVSLFDGMSCGQVALKRIGFNVENYYASEIDKYAIAVTQKNHPNTKQMGDVSEWKTWDIDWSSIDLIMGGSPCQGFSFAGKQLAFDDPRSRLFFEFVKIYRHIKEHNPEVKFFLENVKMKKEFQNIINDQLGVFPIVVNSSLVSAQNRVRFYWTNINGVKLPEDRNIYLQDILAQDVDPKYLMSSGWLKWWAKNNEFQIRKKYSSVDPVKAITMTARQYASWNGNFIKMSKKGVYKKNQTNSSCLTGGGHSGGNHSDMDVIARPVQIGTATDIKGFDIIKRVYSRIGKSPTLTTMTGGHRHPKIALNDVEYRRLTPVECERLQTLPDNYSDNVSDSQRYKMLGNGWTVDVIAHCFSYIDSHVIQYRKTI